MNKKHWLALFAISSFASAASAEMVSVDAGHYTLSYDNAFWGTGAFSQSGDLFTFSNLYSGLGTHTAASTTNAYIDTTNNFSAKDLWLPTLTITADAGYKLKSVTSGGTGSVNADAPWDPAVNKQGSKAGASVTVTTQWTHDNGSYLADEGTSTFSRSYQEAVNSYGDFVGGGGIPGIFNQSTTNNFSNNLASVIGRFSATGWAQAAGVGSWASAYLETAYFSVEVAPASPVPEPETWAMFLAGLGVLGALTRRRGSAATSRSAHCPS